jgi:hypothetical protein
MKFGSRNALPSRRRRRVRSRQANFCTGQTEVSCPGSTGRRNAVSTDGTIYEGDT